MNEATMYSLSRAACPARVDLGDRVEHDLPALGEERVEDLLLRLEVVVDEPVGDAGLVGDVGDAAGWKPWRAKTRIAASRISRRLSTPRPRAAIRRVTSVGPAVGARHAVGEARQLLAHLVLAREVEVGGDEALLVGRAREHLAPRVDDHRAAEALLVGRVRADLVGGDDERLVLDRARAHEDLPVRLAGDLGERGRQRDHARAADREDPEQLGEAQVVADGQAERRRRRRPRTARSRRRAPRTPTRGTRLPPTTTSNMWILR